MKSFVELLVVAEDKATGEVFARVAEHVSDHLLAAIPGCLFRQMRLDGSEVRPGETIAEGEYTRLIVNFDVLFACAYGRAWFEDHSVTYEEVRSRIPATDADRLKAIVKELYYFYSNMNRDEIDELFPEESAEEAEINPPEEPEPSPDSASQTNSET